ncbi:alpha-amylase family glycosyl hydrolase [Deinococcus misasensis]|uniref:alpha-amylase family glycosyl hydrolase n=1 Tax=Deinococcus misasensis TaxID=392413 RepID=UPI000A022484|nr:alpha-amylase family glycosyl hydrolase [Deinococcus misasensis]
MQKRHGLLALLTLALAACGQQSQQLPTAVEPSETSVSSQTVSGTAIDDWRQQVIYLLFTDRFANGNTANDNAGSANCFDPANARKFHGGDLAGLQGKLGYIKDLGATAIWTTPVYEQVGQQSDGSCGYHGYWPKYAYPANINIEPKLGTSTDLTNLINTMHNTTYNMKYIMDMVVNHAGVGAPIVSQQPSWIHPPKPQCSTLGDPDIYCDLYALPDFAQENSTVANYLTNISKQWVTTYNVDSIRMDTARHVPNTYWSGSWVPGINAAKANVFTFAEAFYDQNASDLTQFMDAGFDSVINFPLRKAFVDSIAKAGSLDILATKINSYVTTWGLNRSLLTINLLDNHDVARFINEPGFGVAEADIRKRYQLALGSLFTVPGIPQIYYGNEIGMYGGTDPDNRRDMPSWAWTDTGRATGGAGFLAGGATPKYTYDYTKKLVTIRKSNEALWKGTYTELWRPNGGQNVMAYYRGSGTNRIIVVLNTSTTTANINVPIQTSGISATDKSALTNGTVFTDQLGYGAPASATVTNGSLPVSIPAQSMAIYKAGAVVPPPPGTSVTFQVQASTFFGQSVHLVGNISQLGAWNTANSLAMTASNCSGSVCTWKVTTTLPAGAIQFKFIKKPGDGGASLTWEGGSNRSYTVPTTGPVTYNGGSWQP